MDDDPTPPPADAALLAKARAREIKALRLELATSEQDSPQEPDHPVSDGGE